MTPNPQSRIPGRVVHDTFGVELQYDTTCAKCGRVSARRERNHDLHVPLPEDESQPAGPLRARAQHLA